MKKESVFTVFLDRDGVINEEPGPILRPEQFRFIPGSVQAIRRINDKGWRCLVVSNQAAFAKRQLTMENFQRICEKMEQGLREVGAHVDDLFYCPHYPRWQEGWDAELCGPCDCRKPGTLLFHQAAEKHGVDWKQTVFIGDTTTDFEAARRLGIPMIGVQTGHAGKDGKCDGTPTLWVKDLQMAVEEVLLDDNTRHDIIGCNMDTCE